MAVGVTGWWVARGMHGVGRDMEPGAVGGGVGV